MALRLEILLLGLPFSELQPSCFLCRTPYQYIVPASMLKGSSVSCALQFLRRFPVSGFCQMTLQWLSYFKRWGQDSSVRELPKPETSLPLPTSLESCCPSLCQSLCPSHYQVAAFPPGNPYMCRGGEGHFWETGRIVKILNCECRIHATGWGRQSQTSVDRNGQEYYCIPKATEFSDEDQKVGEAYTHVCLADISQLEALLFLSLSLLICSFSFLLFHLWV